MKATFFSYLLTVTLSFTHAAAYDREDLFKLEKASATSALAEAIIHTIAPHGATQEITFASDLADHVNEILAHAINYQTQFFHITKILNHIAENTPWQSATHIDRDFLKKFCAELVQATAFEAADYGKDELLRIILFLLPNTKHVKRGADILVTAAATALFNTTAGIIKDKIFASPESLAYNTRREFIESFLKNCIYETTYHMLGDVVRNGCRLELDDVVTTPHAWSMLTYMQADNNFTNDGNNCTTGTIEALSKFGSNANINLLIQLDKKNVSGTERYKVLPHQPLQNVGSLTMEMGVEQQADLEEAMAWIKSKFPAQRYILNLWNHGTGTGNSILDSTLQSRGILYDDTQLTFLSNTALKAACATIKTTIGKNLDLLCMSIDKMAMVEVAYQLRESVDYFIASEQIGWAWTSGDPMQYGLQKLFDDPAMPTRQVAQALVASYQQFFTDQSPAMTEAMLNNQIIRDSYTFSAIDLSKITTAITAFKNVAQAIATRQPAINPALEAARAATITFHGDDYIDLVDFYDTLAKQPAAASLVPILATAQEAALAAVASNVAGSVYAGRAHGLSLYFPAGHVQGSYYESDFATDTGWADVLENR